MRTLYRTLETSSTPAALLFPWFPGPARRRKDRTTKELFTKLYHYVELRRNAAVPTPDAFDLLLAQGMSNIEILEVSLKMIERAMRSLYLIIVHSGCHFRWSE